MILQKIQNCFFPRKRGDKCKVCPARNICTGATQKQAPCSTLALCKYAEILNANNVLGKEAAELVVNCAGSRIEETMYSVGGKVAEWLAIGELCNETTQKTEIEEMALWIWGRFMPVNLDVKDLPY